MQSKDGCGKRAGFWEEKNEMRKSGGVGGCDSPFVYDMDLGYVPCVSGRLR